MSDKSFGRRRRGGMRFRPPGGIAQPKKHEQREAQQARAEAVGEDARAPDAIFEKNRFQKEIDRAENIAAGLPPEGMPEAETAAAGDDAGKKDFREPALETPAVVEEETPFAPVQIKEPPPEGILDNIRAVANKVIRKVQRLLKPKPKRHKEVIINAEALETRVAVLEEGRLEEFTIERTSEERLVGSIFKGKVRNLEDGLKAALRGPDTI